MYGPSDRTPELDAGLLSAVLDAFLAEPDNADAFVVGPARGACLQCTALGLRWRGDAYRLDCPPLEAGARTRCRVVLENIGLDAVRVELAGGGEWLRAALDPRAPRLEVGETAILDITLVAPRQAGLRLESSVVLNLARSTGRVSLSLFVTLPVVERCPMLHWHTRGSACPPRHDFGTIEALELLASPGTEEGGDFSVTVGNAGSAACEITGRIEGDGFAFLSDAPEYATGPATAAADSGGFDMRADADGPTRDFVLQSKGPSLCLALPAKRSVTLRVRPTLLPPGARHACLVLTAGHEVHGLLAETRVQLAAWVRNDGPIFALEIPCDPVSVVRGETFEIPVRVINHGGTPGEVVLRAACGKTPLGETRLPLPMETRAGSVVRLAVDCAALAPGPHVLDIEGRVGDRSQCHAPGRLSFHVREVAVAPPVLDLGMIDAGGEAWGEVAVLGPAGRAVTYAVEGDAAAALQVEALPGSRFRVGVANHAAGGFWPETSPNAAAIVFSIPDIGFLRRVPVGFQLAPQDFAAPTVVDFGRLQVGDTASVGIVLSTKGGDSLLLHVTSPIRDAVFDPGGTVTIPARNTALLRVSFPLTPESCPGEGALVPYAGEVVLQARGILPARTVRVVGEVAMTLGWLCPVCHAVNSEAAQVCRLCDSPLDDAAMEAALPHMVRRCPRCRGLVRNVYAFCPEDGSLLEPL